MGVIKSKEVYKTQLDQEGELLPGDLAAKTDRSNLSQSQEKNTNCQACPDVSVGAITDFSYWW